ncbi:MAG: hypothetical protein ABIH37_01245 [archaeon]
MIFLEVLEEDPIYVGEKYGGKHVFRPSDSKLVKVGAPRKWQTSNTREPVEDKWYSDDSISRLDLHRAMNDKDPSLRPNVLLFGLVGAAGFSLLSYAGLGVEEATGILKNPFCHLMATGALGGTLTSLIAIAKNSVDYRDMVERPNRVRTYQGPEAVGKLCDVYDGGRE